MAINKNLNFFRGSNTRISLGGEMATPIATNLSPAFTSLLPITPRPSLPILPLLPKTTTQIAQGAVNLLSGSNQGVLQRAINMLKNRNVSAGGLMNFLERKVKIGEVLAQVAKEWQDDTQQDFAEAFQMPKDDLEAMDAIVSIAILNDPELEGELMEENATEPTQNDLLENRRIVWQYPPPGTVLQPPYVVLLAVEHRDTRRAQETIQSILGGLVDYQGYKVPRATTQKLTGGAPLMTVNPTVNPALLNNLANLKLNT